MTRIPLAAAVLIFLASSALAAQNAGSFNGTFASQNATFDVTGGVAFTGTSSLDGTTRVLLVAITSSPLDAGAVADFVDRRRAIEQLVKDDETPVVYLEFAPDGKWRGLSYHFGPGNGCGYCTSEVNSTVKLANGRLTGSVTGSEKDRPFDVSLDVPILADDHGAPLPAGGGAPGKAFLAYHAALLEGDAGALKGVLSPGNLEVFTRAQQANNVGDYVAYLADKHGMRNVIITRGWSTATKASLLIEGQGAAGKMIGEVLLVFANGAWGVDEELVELVIGASTSR